MSRLFITLSFAILQIFSALEQESSELKEGLEDFHNSQIFIDSLTRRVNISHIDEKVEGNEKELHGVSPEAVHQSPQHQAQENISSNENRTSLATEAAPENEIMHDSLWNNEDVIEERKKEEEEEGKRKFVENNLRVFSKITSNSIQATDNNYYQDEINASKKLERRLACSVNDYYDSVNHICSPCYYTCWTCSGTGSNQCLTCTSGYAIIQLDYTCKCADGYYLDTYPNVCSPCDSTCLTCDFSNINNCLSCFSNAHLSAHSTCDCNVGFFLDTGTGKCFACDSTCKTCAGTKNYCTSCYDNAELSSSHTCECNENFYWNTNECDSCYSTCKTCTGSTDNECASCFDNAELSGSNTCECSDGFFPDADSSNCSTCSSTCKTCSASTDHDCTSCLANAELSTSNICECNDSFYWNASKCDDCASTCKTCTGPSNNNCISCFDNAELSGSNTCVCKDDFFPNTDSANCSPCSSTCKTCLGSTDHDCASCYDNAELSGSSTCECNDGFYWNVNKCAACDSTCKLCTGPANNECVSCYSNAVLSGSSTCECKDGFIKIGSVCTEQDPFIFYLSFDTLQGVIYDTKSKIPALTGNSNAFYPNYDEADPLAGFKRGFYFNGVSSLVHLPIYPGYSSPLLSFGYSFTFSIWANIENSSGTIISKQDKFFNPIFSLEVEAGTIKISLYFKTSGLTYFFYENDVGLYEWSHIAFTAEYTSQTKMVFYLNGIADHSVDIGTDYFEDASTDITFTLGAAKDSLGYSNYFQGFIYDIKGYNSVVSISTLALPAALCTEDCKSCLTSGICIPNCLISQYWVGPQYNSCSKCSDGCPSCRDSSQYCNLCDSQKCYACNDYTADSCLECVADASYLASCDCNSGFGWNPSSEACEACKENQFKANDSCNDCPPLCAQCESSNKCNSCVKNAELNSGSCVCPSEQLENSTCLSVFNAALSITQNNILVLSFSEDLQHNLTDDQIMVLVHNQTFPPESITYSSNKVYLISCNFGKKITKNTTVEVHFTGNIKSTLDSVLLEKYLSGTLYDTATAEENTAIHNQVSAGVKIVAGLSVILSVFSLNPSSLWTMLNTIQLISYIPYASYPISEKISVFFKSMNGINIVPNLFLFIIDENKTESPYYQAKIYGYDNYLILVNIGNDVTTLCGIIIVIPFVYYFSKCSQRFIGKKFQKIVKEFKFGTFLRFWIISYLEFGFAAVIGILSIENFEVLESSIELTNYFLCWTCIILIAISPFLHAYFSFKNLKKIIKRQDKKWLTYWDSLFYEFKNNSGYLSTQYYSLFFARRLVFIAVQVFLNNFPQSQLTINAISSLSIALFVSYYKPFEDKVIQATNVVTEFGISIIFLLLTPYFFDLESNGLEIMNNIVIGFTASLIIACTVGPFINSIRSMCAIVKEALANNSQPSPAKKSRNSKIIKLNKSDNFFDDSTQTNMQETENCNYISEHRKIIL